MSTDRPDTSTDLHATLDAARMGDLIHVSRTNGDGSLTSRVSGPVLAAPDLDRAVGIDLLDGEPHVVRRKDGSTWGDIAHVHVTRAKRVIAIYSRPPRPTTHPEGA